MLAPFAEQLRKTIDEIKSTSDPIVREFVEGRPTEDDGGVPGGAVVRA